jgi:hypothetical protein
LGIAGWGVGGIEAEAAMLGQVAISFFLALIIEPVTQCKNCFSTI